MWWAASIIFVRLISVSILANRSPRQWRRGTRIIAGAYKNCCRSRCRRLNGSHQSDEGGHHEPYKVSLRGGAGTTVNCGATCHLHVREMSGFVFQLIEPNWLMY